MWVRVLGVISVYYKTDENRCFYLPSSGAVPAVHSSGGKPSSRPLPSTVEKYVCEKIAVGPTYKLQPALIWRVLCHTYRLFTLRKPRPPSVESEVFLEWTEYTFCSLQGNASLHRLFTSRRPYPCADGTLNSTQSVSSLKWLILARNLEWMSEIIQEDTTATVDIMLMTSGCIFCFYIFQIRTLKGRHAHGDKIAR